MKKLKFILLPLLIFTIVFSSCKKDDVDPDPTQDIPVFTLKIDGVEVEENTQDSAVIKSYTVVGDAGKLGFHITNNKNEDIKLRMTVVNVLAGANGDGVELCFATCVTSINLNDTEVRTIIVGHTTTTAETHILNTQVGNRDFECTLKINQVDDNEADIPNGKEVYFTYKYMPT